MQRAFDEAVARHVEDEGVAAYLSALFEEEVLRARGFEPDQAAVGAVPRGELAAALETVLGDEFAGDEALVCDALDALAPEPASGDESGTGGEDEEDVEGGGGGGMCPGDRCLAVLDEDGQWHEATVDAAPAEEGGAYRVTFVEFGKPQDARAGSIVPLASAVDDGGSDEELEKGACELCRRVMPLTAHHLRPRQMHRRLRKRFSRDVLNRCTMICRACHSMVHKCATNAELAQRYYTIELLRDLPGIAAWAKYAHKQYPVSRRLL